jgi:hypothetical protein
MPPLVAPQQQASGKIGQILTTIGQGHLNRQENAMDRLSREAMHADSLVMQHVSQQRQIDAQAQSQKQAAEYAFKRAAVESGLERELANREFDNKLKEIQARAKAEAEQFDFEFSTENKAKMAHIQNYIQEAEQSGLYTPEQLGEIRRQGLGELAGIKKTAIPAKGPKLPEWAKPFGISVDPDSQIAGTFEERNGKLNFKPLPKEMQQGFMQQKQQEEKMKLDGKIQEKMIDQLMAPIETESGERFPTRDEIANRYIAWKDAQLFASTIGREPRGSSNRDTAESQPKQNGKRQPKTRPPGKLDDIEQSVVAGEPVKVSNREQFDKLRSGDLFVAPDGSIWTKK